jgi:hypothetical protein
MRHSSGPVEDGEPEVGSVGDEGPVAAGPDPTEEGGAGPSATGLLAPHPTARKPAQASAVRVRNRVTALTSSRMQECARHESAAFRRPPVRPSVRAGPDDGPERGAGAGSGRVAVGRHRSEAAAAPHAAEDEERERDDDQDDEDRPQHGGTPSG